MEIDKKDLTDWSAYIVMILESYVLTQGDLGKKLGTTQQSISNWISGRRDPSPKKQEILHGIAAEVNVSVDDFPIKGEELKKRRYAFAIKYIPKRVRALAVEIQGLGPKKQKKLLADLNAYADLLESKNADVTTQSV